MKVEEMLEEIEGMADNSTPGPWVYDYGNWQVESRAEDSFLNNGTRVPYRAGIVDISDEDDYKNIVHGPSDGEFIANARQDVPRLIAALRKCMEQRDFEIKSDTHGLKYEEGLIKVYNKELLSILKGGGE